ncbi:MAG: thioredoxin domain-containing protein [Desulfosoma sp.]|uniref:thioredoxin domain-containing protein n=1 Tax=Desulfosoma sp. TaxID=2603217 RepID=UPI00404B8032
MPNKLAGEKSPYLLQHADNPVDWYPWSEEAFAKARREDKPVFLSIGYATCHWCHVMAHESFEDPEVARYLNEHFVAVKVDREERPDIDGVYMRVCQVIAGHGGWPLSVFLTPEKVPLFAGTYFPKSARLGMPGFLDLLREVHRLWRDGRPKLMATGDKILQVLQQASQGPESFLEESDLDRGFGQLRAAFDPRWGGFGDAPKFPTPHQLTFLLRYHARTGNPAALGMVEETLMAMRQGGLFDQLGYGFHRYSVDARWLVPHFEKMLYDQALLAMAYLETYQVTGKAFYAQVAREIFTYVLRDMTDADGGFYSAEDADTEGEEGLFYTWTPEEIAAVLPEDQARWACEYFGVTTKGNFEKGRSVLHVAEMAQTLASQAGLSVPAFVDLIDNARAALFMHRKTRPAPLKDDKILTAWNGLMAAALALGFRVLGEAQYLSAATKAVHFVWNTLRDPQGRLYRRYRHGHVAHRGYLDDYAFLAWALLELYEASLDVEFLQKAVEVHEAMLDLFWNPESGGLDYTAKDAEKLIIKEREVYDGALPSGNSTALNTLGCLAQITGDVRWEKAADGIVRAFAHEVKKYPRAYTHFLNGWDRLLGPGCEVVLVGTGSNLEKEAMVQCVRQGFRPRTVLVVKPLDEARRAVIEKLAPFVASMHPVEGRAAAYVCRARQCAAPTTDVEQLRTLLNEAC